MEDKQKFGRLSHWGKSMYGGWYIVVWAADPTRYGWVGFHFDKLHQLRAWAKDHGVYLLPDHREDN